MPDQPLKTTVMPECEKAGAAGIVAQTTNDADSADEVLCQCSGTTRSNIQALFEQGMNMDDISSWTGAISGCGGCEWDISQFLNDLAKK